MANTMIWTGARAKWTDHRTEGAIWPGGSFWPVLAKHLERLLRAAGNRPGKSGRTDRADSGAQPACWREHHGCRDSRRPDCEGVRHDPHFSRRFQTPTFFESRPNLWWLYSLKTVDIKHLTTLMYFCDHPRSCVHLRVYPHTLQSVHARSVSDAQAIRSSTFGS